MMKLGTGHIVFLQTWGWGNPHFEPQQHCRNYYSARSSQYSKMHKSSCPIDSKRTWLASVRLPIYQVLQRGGFLLVPLETNQKRAPSNSSPKSGRVVDNTAAFWGGLPLSVRRMTSGFRPVLPPPSFVGHAGRKLCQLCFILVRLPPQFCWARRKLSQPRFILIRPQTLF